MELQQTGIPWVDILIAAIVFVQLIARIVSVIAFQIAKMCGRIESPMAVKIGKVSWGLGVICGGIGGMPRRYADAKYGRHDGERPSVQG